MAVAAVGSAFGGLAVQMVVQPGMQRPPGQCALQLVDQAILAEGRLWITAG
jgi:hypothetical protein